MVAGPQILSAVFLATSEQWRRNSAVFVAGAGFSITLVITVAYVLGIGAVGQGASNTTLSAIILVVLLIAMVQTYRTRDEAEPPEWMGKLGTATPRFSFRLGFLLLGFFSDQSAHIGRCRLLPRGHRRAMGRRAPVRLSHALRTRCSRTRPTGLWRTRRDVPPKGPQLDGDELMGRQRGCDRLFHRPLAQQPLGLILFIVDGYRHDRRPPGG